MGSSGCKKVVVAYDSSLVTREETPDSLPGLVKQRTRWNQGFLHVYRKGEWRRLPTFGQRLLARYTLTGPFVQAFFCPLAGIMSGASESGPDGPSFGGKKR